ncbi:UDP-N-acetylglucosamine 1-carboxyvinyltransferase [Ruminococcus sp.]|uniref:UDP-N-acetylglucosamine 1-carboxyvinyltransferase n=1 Tax=Ruminococcus sp. TaxID=41978 RepID=UPI001B4C0089|nr:UDP-N-acetylglucosamine 1-carboxyvinyltransferase [Ruminococcus sp.]MBP5432993.1 UDP-N-acetylglucosamine 1-carboxyvinyltransferase [Ruminococcus sp.]
MITLQGTDSIFGEINLSGAKNAALPLMVGACLCSEDVILHNMPVELNDVKVMLFILNSIGYNVTVEDHSMIFHTPSLSDTKTDIPIDAGKIRYSLLLLPLLLTQQGKVNNPVPGGCKLGDRKYDIHLDSLRKMGASIVETENEIIGNLNDGFHGADLLFHIATTSGSESAILAAVLAKGKTVIMNANTRPEVIDLINFLNSMGADISYKTRYIEVNGVEKLHGGEYTIIKDSHEAVSYMILAAMLRSEILVKDFNLNYITEDATLLKQIGVDVFEWGGNVYVSAKGKVLRPFSMATSPYPGINSDMQPILAALACTIEGESIVTDTRFNERFQYVNEFKKFGLDIVNYENCAVIHGCKNFEGADVFATDLRAGAALTFLGCCANGVTTIDNYYQTMRGYVGIIDKLNQLGVDIYEK